MIQQMKEEGETNMAKLSKRESSISYMKENEKLFQCPICKTNMQVQENGNITCEQKHSFDIAKQGYVNFMTKAIHSMYSKELFQSRYEIIQSGLYNPVHEKIANLIDSGVQSILDTGCGEGTHLAKICEKLHPQVVSLGIDISKEGIFTAAKHYERHIWCVGDLANSPFQAQSIDYILNFLSPANYNEFKRILKPNGKVIKVVPQASYLQQLRELAFAKSEKEQYSNEQTVSLFKDQFSNVHIERVTYNQPLEHHLLPKLLEMTPLGWHIENNEDIAINEITIDLDILIGEF